jgi:hypothetical protein
LLRDASGLERPCVAQWGAALIGHSVRVADADGELDVRRIFDRLWSAGAAPDFELAMRAIVGWADLAAVDLSEVGQQSLALARRHWHGDAADPEGLAQASAACWTYLESKNGNSTTIADREDQATRLLICCLHPDRDDWPVNADLWLGFALEMVAKLGIDQSEVEAVLD